MAKEKGRKYDGRSRPSNDLYKKRWNEIFKKEKPKTDKTIEYKIGGRKLPLGVD